MGEADLLYVVVDALAKSNVDMGSFRNHLEKAIKGLETSVENRAEVEKTKDQLAKARRAIMRAVDKVYWIDDQDVSKVVQGLSDADYELLKLERALPPSTKEIKASTRSAAMDLIEGTASKFWDTANASTFSNAMRYPSARKEGAAMRKRYAREMAHKSAIMKIKASYHSVVLDCPMCDKSVQDQCVAAMQCDVLDPHISFEPKGNRDAVFERA